MRAPLRARWLGTAAEHAGGHQQVAIVAMKGREALLQQVAGARRERRLTEGAAVPYEQAADLDDEERVACCEAYDLGRKVRTLRSTDLVAEQGCDTRLVQAVQRHTVGAATETVEQRPRRGVGVPVGADDQDRQDGQVGGHHVEQLQRPLIGPMEIIEHEQRRPLGRHLLERPHHAGVRRCPR